MIEPPPPPRWSIIESFGSCDNYPDTGGYIQIESIDEALTNCLWSILHLHIWVNAEVHRYFDHPSNSHINKYFHSLSLNYFKRPVDTIPDTPSRAIEDLKEYFFHAEWYEVYDLMEFTANTYYGPGSRGFTDACNLIFEREMSAYRFVGGRITRITEEEQISEIEKAMAGDQNPVRTHINRSLELMTNRNNPDYRNSIKESISAVESLVSQVVGERGTLGQLLKKLEEDIGLHPALKASFSSLYGYTSNADGIRHAILDSDKLTFDDAKFFLVVCSAFGNFVRSKIRV